MTEVTWTPPPPQKDGDEPRPYRSEMPQPALVDGRPLRVGDRVRHIGGDSFIPVGMSGLVTNTHPAMGALPAQAMVSWDNECLSRVVVADLELASPRIGVTVHPTLMAPFTGSTRPGNEIENVR